MLISYTKNFLFVHIAKTGGTSVRTALRPYRGAPRYAIPLVLCSLFSQMTAPRHKLGVKFPRHSKAIAAKEMLPEAFYEQLFKFTIVRNPWDLEVSSYHHVKREKPHLLDGVSGFAEFLRLKFDTEGEGAGRMNITKAGQWEYLVDLKGELIVDFIGRYENLQADFETICKRIGITCPELPYMRKSARRDYREYYTDETAALVERIHRKDIELLNYSF